MSVIGQNSDLLITEDILRMHTSSSVCATQALAEISKNSPLKKRTARKMWVFLLHLEKSNTGIINLLKKSSVLDQIILQAFCMLLQKGWSGPV